MPDVRTVLNGQFDSGHYTLDYTVGDLTVEQLHHHHEGSTIGTPASIYLHVAWVEDLVINHMLQGRPTIYDSQGWAEKLPDAPVHRGPSSLEWALSVKAPDAASLKAYADAVRPALTEYIANASDEELDRVIEFFAGPTPIYNALAMLIWNLANHTGELAALRGLAGLKGLPM
ncbi:MAG: DinB family protein [Thermomicrobiales bacterium]|nr:DinB family protein [Thermomicrobiales bacterium]